MSLRTNACQASYQLSSTWLQGAIVLTVPQPAAAILVPVLDGKASHSRFCLQMAATPQLLCEFMQCLAVVKLSPLVTIR